MSLLFCCYASSGVNETYSKIKFNIRYVVSLWLFRMCTTVKVMENQTQRGDLEKWVENYNIASYHGLIIFFHLLLPWTYNQMHDAWFKLTCYHPPPPHAANPRDKSSLLWPRGIVWGGLMRTLGVGNRPPSKKKIANLGGYARGWGRGACIFDDEHNQPLFTEFFFIFYQDIAIIKVYCLKLET